MDWLPFAYLAIITPICVTAGIFAMRMTLHPSAEQLAE